MPFQTTICLIVDLCLTVDLCLIVDTAGKIMLSDSAVTFQHMYVHKLCKDLQLNM